jgi:hypothetical protein
MYNFGLEITSVFCGTICPELVAQYHRNIHDDLPDPSGRATDSLNHVYTK